MEGVASEVSLKIRSAIKAKLVELGTYVDEELPDYIMVLVANKKTKDQMDDDLSLFLGHNTERFTSWLHHVLQKLNAAALLHSSAASAEKSKVVAPQEETKRRDSDEEKRREKEEERKREREEEKKRGKAEDAKVREEERRKSKEKEKIERKRKSTEKKSEKKEKKIKKSESPPPPVKEKKVIKEIVKEKEKEKPKLPLPKEEPTISIEKATTPVTEAAPLEPAPEVIPKKMKPLVRGKISSADIFRAESQAEHKEEEEEGLEDLLVLRADVDELGLELEEEPAPRKTKQEQPHRTVHLKPEGKEEDKIEQKSPLKIDNKDKDKTVRKEKPVSKEKTDTRDKVKGKAEQPPPRLSARERLGGIVTSKSNASRDKPSVLDRLGSSISNTGRQIISLREESSGGLGSEHSQGAARTVSSAIASAHRSVCILPPTNASGKKLEARVRPLMSRQTESSHGVSRGSSSSSGERIRESSSRSSSGRVVSAVGAVLKRTHTPSDSEEEEYDPKKPGLSGLASKVEVTPRPRRPRAIQANTALILRAMADAHKSVNKPSRHSKEREREKSEKSKSRKKHKGELFSRSYREREQSVRHRVTPEPDTDKQETIRIRKIAITVPNAIHKESEKQDKEKKMVKQEEEEEEEMEVSISIRQQTPEAMEEPVEEKTKEVKEPVMETQESKEQTSDNEFGMEEVEELEEEVVDEGIEEEQPQLQLSLPSSVLTSGENTKFIVTLEGMDAEEFPEKDESVGIRARLGARVLPQDTEDQVEEYIEEVEEWEEEEEVPDDESMETSGLPGSGVSTGVKSRLKVTSNPAVPIQSGGVKERCKYWPLCKAGEACIYHHPTVTCKSFPACKFGDKCLFIHPNCLYDAACTRLGCPYTHASSRNFAMVSATAAQKHKTVAPNMTSLIKCKFFPKCTNLSCPFLHPKACYYGASCTQANCPFTHPTVPMGAKLKWVAPKAATATTTIPTATTVTASQTTSLIPSVTSNEDTNK